MYTRLAPATLLAVHWFALSAWSQDAEKITYEDHIKPLLENKCFSCHNPDKKKGDLDLTSFGAVMTGGGGGSIVDAGNADSSRIWTTCAKKEEPFMPPEGSPLNAKELEILSKWISGGLLETKSSVAKKSSKPKVDMAVAVTSGKPEGPIARPEHVLLEPVIVTPRTTAITAMAASPWTSLVALAAPKQVLLYDTDSRQLAGIFPYTEGYARTLQFSRNGSLLVMGGGRGGKLGHAIVWDVKTGKRIVEVGKEFDQVMSADISPDHTMVAIGCTSKKVKCYDTATGEELYTISKHTEWLLGTKFSPDGVLLATADRNGNVMVWEASNGGEFYILGQHKGPCNDLAWRADSNLLASCSKDGTISLWEMNEGKQVKNWAAHGGGVQSVSFTPEGLLVSSGDDGLVRVWDVNGNKKAEAPTQNDIVAKVVALHDSKTCATANWRGEVKLYTLQEKMAEVGSLSSNPPLIAQRIIEAEKKAAELIAALPGVEALVAKAKTAVTAEEAKLAETKKKQAEANAHVANLEAEIKNLPTKLTELDKQVKETQTKRQAQAEALKKHESLQAEIQKLSSELAAKQAEKAKLTAPDQAPKAAELAKVVQDLSTKIEGLKKTPAPQPPLAELDKQIKSLQDQVAASNTAKAAKPKELEVAKKALENWPKAIAENDKQIAATKAALQAAEATVTSHKSQISIFQKLPTTLKAAQFNVGVLAEKEKLALLEGSITDYTAAKKENEQAKVANAAKIESAKKAIAEATNQLPQVEATLNKLKAELTGLEEAVKPTQGAHATAAAKFEEAKKTLTAKEAELVALGKTRDDNTAAAKKGADDISKALEALKKKLAEVAAKLKAPEEQVKSKQANLTLHEGKLAAAKKASTDLTTALGSHEAAHKQADATYAKTTAELQAAEKAANDTQKASAEANKARESARQAVTAHEKTVNEAKAKNSLKPEQEKALADARTALANAEKAAAEKATSNETTKAAIQPKRDARAASEKAFAAAKQTLNKTKQDLSQANNALKQAESLYARSKTELEAALKTATPLRGQHDSLSKEVAAQEKARTDKLALPATYAATFTSQSKPVSDQIAALKGSLPTLEKAANEARTKLEGEIKIVEAKRAEVAKATEAREAEKTKKANAEAAIAAATKDNPTRDANLAEINQELTKLQPQLEPLRAKVKQLETQYLTLLGQ